MKDEYFIDLGPIELNFFPTVSSTVELPSFEVSTTRYEFMLIKEKEKMRKKRIFVNQIFYTTYMNIN